MRRISMLLLLFGILPSNTFPAVKQKNQRLQATSAALVVQSLQLGDKAHLLKIIKTKEGNLTLQEDMMIDAASEMKYIATVAYFEGNLLGAVLALKKEFKLHFINNRILELENAIRGTISSLEPIQLAHSRIGRPWANWIDQSRRWGKYWRYTRIALRSCRGLRKES